MKKETVILLVVGTLIVLATIWVVNQLKNVNKVIKASKAATTTP